MLTRREFLQLACSLPFLDLVQFVAPTPQIETCKEVHKSSPWQFPLQFPAYFAKESPRRKVRKVFAPMVAR